MRSSLRVASRRGALVLSLFVAAAAAVAARPAAPGLTYRVRMVAVPPDMPGMSMPQTVIVGHGTSMGTLSRLDIDSVSGQIPMAVGDYILTLDSGRVFTVSPSSKTYTDGMAAMAAMPPEVLAQASVSNVNVTTEKLGAGETIQGYATEKVRMTVTYAISIMGQSMNTMSTVEMAVAKLPAEVITPFDGAMPKELAQGPMKELAEKMMAARKAITGTPLKTVNTSTLSSPMLPQTITTVTTVEMLDLKTGDVDPALLKVPEGYTKKP